MAIRHLVLNETIQEAVTAPRIRNQLFPMELDYESGFDSDIIKELARFGHNVSLGNGIFAVISAAARGEDGLLYGTLESRRNSSVAGY